MLEMHDRVRAPQPMRFGVTSSPYLTSLELVTLMRDLTEGPSARFLQIAVRRLSAGVSQKRLRKRFDRIVAEVPRLGWRVRRDDGGWHYEPAGCRPELYVETHRLDADSEPARLRLDVECRRPLDPVSGPLGRASLLRYATGAADVVVAVHALAVGSCSPSWLMQELTQARGPAAGRAPMPYPSPSRTGG